jgi:hypothetical protein
MRLARFTAAVMGFVFLARLAMGGLTWSSTKIEGNPTAGQESFEAVFTFKNTGAKPVRIISIKPSCGCTTATAEEKPYAPGKTGELKAQVDLRGRSGHQEKIIAVTTDDAPNAPISLILSLNVPSIVDILPRLLVWSRGSKAEPKEVAITAGGTVEVRLSRVQWENQQFIVEQLTDRPGSRYRLRITPRSTDLPMSTFIQLTFETALDHARATAVNMTVRAIVQ